MSMFGFPSPALPATLQIAGVSLSVYCYYYHLSAPPHLLPLIAEAARLKYETANENECATEMALWPDNTSPPF